MQQDIVGQSSTSYSKCFKFQRHDAILTTYALQALLTAADSFALALAIGLPTSRAVKYTSVRGKKSTLNAACRTVARCMLGRLVELYGGPK